MADADEIIINAVIEDRAELRQLLGQVLLSAGIALQLLSQAMRVARPAQTKALIDKAAEQLSVIVQATQRAEITRTTDKPKLPDFDDPEHWRQRAERTRALAVGDPPDVQERPLEIARQYEQLAKTVADRCKR
jgi:hypothetical protein